MQGPARATSAYSFHRLPRSLMGRRNRSDDLPLGVVFLAGGVDTALDTSFGWTGPQDYYV